MTKSTKTSLKCQNFDYGMEIKITQHFFQYTSRSLICIQIVAVAFWSEEEVSARKGPRDLLLPRPGSALGGSGRKTTLVRDHEYFNRTKVH